MCDNESANHLWGIEYKGNRAILVFVITANLFMDVILKNEQLPCLRVHLKRLVQCEYKKDKQPSGHFDC